MDGNENVVVQPDAGTGTTDTATENKADSTDTNAGEVKETTADQKKAEEVKTYDQKYVDDLLAKQEEDKKAAVEKALAESKMTPEEKEEQEKSQKEKDIADREAAIAHRELQADTKEILSEKGLPESLMGVVIGKDKDTTVKNVDALKVEFDKAVQAQVEERLKGKTPSTGTGSTVQTEASTMSAEIDKYL